MPWREDSRGVRLLRLAAPIAALTAICGCYDLAMSPVHGTDSGTDGGTEVDCGDLAWAKRAGGPSDDMQHSGETGGTAAVLAGGSQIIAGGSFAETATFGQGEDGETTVTSLASCHNGFLASYAPGGELQWLSALLGPSHTEPKGIARLGDGTLAAVGNFGTSIAFGPGGESELMLEVPDIPGTSSYALFVADYTASGDVVWASQVTNTGTTLMLASAVTRLAAGSAALAITGAFGGDASFGAGEATEAVLSTGSSVETFFVAAYADDGTLVWAGQAVGESGGVDLTELDGGDLLVTGWFEGDATFGPGEAQETTLSSPDNKALFLARYGADGALVWAKAQDGSGEILPSALVVLADGSSIAVGTFEGTAFGNEGVDDSALISEGETDVFVARFTSDGELVWTRQAGGAKTDAANDIVLRESGGLAVAGSFQDTAVFGAGEEGAILLDSRGGADGFISFHAADGSLECVRQVGGEGLRDAALALVTPSNSSVVAVGAFEQTATFSDPDEPEAALVSAGSTDLFVVRLEM